MRWEPLSTFLRPLWQRARGMGREDIRWAAAVLIESAGYDPATMPPAMVNVAALAYSLRERLLVHELRPGVARCVHETDLHSLPSEPPTLLRSAWLIEAHEPERGGRLFGDCASLGGYEADGTIYLVGLGYPDGAYVARWRPRWTGEDLAEGVVTERNGLIDDAVAHDAWAREAARFATVLGVLLDAEGTPLRTDDEGERRKRRGVTTGREGETVTRHVYLRPQVRTQAPSQEPTGPLDPTGKASVAVPVRGHVKRQRHGPGNALTKLIYVAGYSARRWVAPDARVIVGV